MLVMGLLENNIRKCACVFGLIIMEKRYFFKWTLFYSFALKAEKMMLKLAFYVCFLFVHFFIKMGKTI